jgi:hypothetical protein
MVSSPIISSQPASPSYSPVESISESPAKRFRCDDLSFLDRFKECNGFKPQFHSNIFLNFPTQYLVFLKNRQWKVNLENEYGDIISAKGNFCVKIEGRVEDVDSNSLLVFDGKDIKNHIDFCNSLLDTNREMTVKMKKITSAFSNKETFEYFKLKEFIANTNSTTTCQTCFNEVQISELRQHNAKHMLLKEIKNQANTCGICGLNNCTVSIKVTSGCGQKANRGIECNCKYYLKISLKSLEKSTTNKPCTNRPVQCQINGCNTVLWSYNIESHYHVNHPGETIPQMITQIEIDRILSGSV